VKCCVRRMPPPGRSSRPAARPSKSCCGAAPAPGRTSGSRRCRGLLALISIAFWYVVAATPGAARWAMLVIALIPTGLLVWAFGRVMRRGVRGSRRYTQLDRLRKDWQARAERGEIPQTTPGGPRVWQNEVEAETQGT